MFERETADEWLMRRAEKARAQWLLYYQRVGDDIEWIFPIVTIAAHTAAYVRAINHFGMERVEQERKQVMDAVEEEGLDVMTYGLLAAHGSVNEMNVRELYAFLHSPETSPGGKSSGSGTAH